MEKILLREAFKDWKDSGIVKPIPIPLTEANNSVLIESTRFPVLGAYKIPVWKLNQKNQNGRVYTEELARKIIKENKITVALDSHPPEKYEPKIKDIIAIGKNPVMESTQIGQILFAECHFVDKEIAEKVQRAIEHGFAFEESSSGYGELNESGEVCVESYDLERYFDLLISDSSYQVSFNKGNEITQESIREAVKKDELNLNSDTNYTGLPSITDEIKESVQMLDDKKKVTSLDEKIMKRNIRKYISEAIAKSDLRERMAELNEIETYFEDFENKEAIADLQEVVTANKKGIQNELDALAEKGKNLDSVVKEKEETVKTLEESNKKLKEVTEKLSSTEKKLKFAFSEMDKAKEAYLKLKEMLKHKVAEMNTKVEPEDYVALIKYTEEIEDRLALEETEEDISANETPEGMVGPFDSLDSAKAYVASSLGPDIEWNCSKYTNVEIFQDVLPQFVYEYAKGDASMEDLVKVFIDTILEGVEAVDTVTDQVIDTSEPDMATEEVIAEDFDDEFGMPDVEMGTDIDDMDMDIDDVDMELEIDDPMFDPEFDEEDDMVTDEEPIDEDEDPTMGGDTGIEPDFTPAMVDGGDLGMVDEDEDYATSIGMYPEKTKKDLQKSIKEMLAKKKAPAKAPVQEAIVYKRKHPTLKIEQETEVVSYYKDLLKRYGKKIQVFQEDFLNCKTIQEAQSCWLRHKNVLSEAQTVSQVERRGLVDRTSGQTKRGLEEKLNIASKVNVDRCKPSDSWL